MSTERPNLKVTLRLENGRLLRSHQVGDKTRHIDPEPLTELVGAGPNNTNVSLPWLLDLFRTAACSANGAQHLDQELAGPKLTAAGHLLYTVLLGQRGADQPTLDLLFQQPGMGAVFSGIRVRVEVISTDENSGKLAGLPWRATQWRNHYLVDYHWTFENCTGPIREGVFVLPLPPKILVLAPDRSSEREVEKSGLQSRDHVERLGLIWEALRPNVTRERAMFDVAATAEEASALLTNMTPNIVYYYGRGLVEGGQAYLTLPSGGKKNIRVGELLKEIPELEKHPPSILFLNVCNMGHAGWDSAGEQLGRRIPLVLANVCPVHPTDARRFAETYWEDVLRKEVDPVVAAHARRASPAVKNADSTALRVSDLTAFAVTGHYGQVRFEHAAGHKSDRLRRAFDLDRLKQRAHFREELDKTLESKTRAHLVLTYGSAADLVHKAPEQLSTFVQARLRHQIAVNIVYLGRYPDDHAILNDEPFVVRETTQADPWDRESLEAALLQQWPRRTAATTLDIKGALNDLAPRKLGTTRQVLWLDAGRIAMGNLSGDDLTDQVDALRFFLSDLTQLVPDLFLVGSLSVETPPEQMADVKKVFDTAGVNRGLRKTLQVTPLDPFDTPPIKDLMDYLKEHGCDPDLELDLAEALLKLGSYHAIVKRLDKCSTPADYLRLNRDLARGGSTSHPGKKRP